MSNPSSVRVPVYKYKESRFDSWGIIWHITRGWKVELICPASVVTCSYEMKPSKTLVPWLSLLIFLCILFIFRRVFSYWYKGLLELTLSKQTRLICPQMLILCGLMQNMLMFLRRRWAYTMPAVMAAGSAGGTVIVMMSRDSMMMVLAGVWKSQKVKVLRLWHIWKITLSLIATFPE